MLKYSERCIQSVPEYADAGLADVRPRLPVPWVVTSGWDYIVDYDEKVEHEAKMLREAVADSDLGFIIFENCRLCPIIIKT